jgi:hypothetical protein
VLFWFTRAANRPDVIAEVEWSRDLITWHRSGESDGVIVVNIVQSITSPAGTDPEIVKATGSVASGAFPGVFFMRLVVREQ